MIEGVLAVDLDQRVLALNLAAADMLLADASAAVGQHLAEVIRNIELARFVAHVLAADGPLEREIVLRDALGQDRFVHAHGAALLDSSGRRIGALLVLQDMTRLHQLETMRRDFVANVSHELKTPITSIKGFVETLREGAMDDPQSARKFLEIVARQADRLNKIIDDLLTLSRIERESQDQQVLREPSALRGVLQAAVDDCQTAMGQRNVQVTLTCPPEVEIDINAHLARAGRRQPARQRHQVQPAGLHHRARRPTPGPLRPHRGQATTAAGSRPSTCGASSSGSTAWTRPASREQGGTGLGLAIVKHIAQAHGGKVSVQSTVGKGCTFTIHLPAGA